MSIREQGYAINQGTRLLQQLSLAGHYIFSMEDAKIAAEKIEIPAAQVKVLLHNLVTGGWITRIKRGLYIGTGKLPGEAQAHPFAIATRLVTPSAISYWSAMHHHGLTEQLPQDVLAMTPQKVYPPSLRQDKEERSSGKHVWEIDAVRYEYVTVKPEHFFGIEEVWIDQTFRVPITDKERTLLEGFAFPRAFGSLSEILGIIEEHLGTVDIGKLTEYALKYGNISVVKRLGWALEQMGVPTMNLKQLKNYPATGYRILDPTKPKQGSYDSRWMVQNNLKGIR